MIAFHVVVIGWKFSEKNSVNARSCVHVEVINGWTFSEKKPRTMLGVHVVGVTTLDVMIAEAGRGGRASFRLPFQLSRPRIHVYTKSETEMP